MSAGAPETVWGPPAPWPPVPDIGGMLQALAGDASDARQEAEKAAEWRGAVLRTLEAQTALLERQTALLERLEGKLAGMGNLGALFGRGK